MSTEQGTTFEIESVPGESEAMYAGGGKTISMGSVSRRDRIRTAQETNPDINDDLIDDKNAKFIRWGTDNQWPKRVRNKLEKSTTMLPMIYKQVTMMFGSGLVWYREIRDGAKITPDFTPIQEVDDFMERSNIQNFMLEQLLDYKFVGNAFQQFDITANGQKIHRLHHLEAEFSRLGSKPSKIAHSQKLYYSARWHEHGSTAIPPNTATYNLFDPNKDLEKQMKKFKRDKSRFAGHSCYPSPGRRFYARPPHAGAYRTNGWLDVHNDIPEIIHQLNDNQMIIKYHIKIPYSYWDSIYKEWATMDKKARDAAIKKKVLDMDTWLTGKSNAGKSFITHYAIDPVSKKPIAGFEITPVDDKLDKTAYIPTSEEADKHLVRSIGMDPSLAGLQPTGGKLGAGSGSDKRVGMINTVSNSKADEARIFAPLELVKKINNWPKELRFAFSHKLPTTLDENPTGSQNTI